MYQGQRAQLEKKKKVKNPTFLLEKSTYNPLKLPSHCQCSSNYQLCQSPLQITEKCQCSSNDKNNIHKLLCF
jgi:hypothetical protein